MKKQKKTLAVCEPLQMNPFTQHANIALLASVSGCQLAAANCSLMNVVYSSFLQMHHSFSATLKKKNWDIIRSP